MNASLLKQLAMVVKQGVISVATEVLLNVENGPGTRRGLWWRTGNSKRSDMIKMQTVLRKLLLQPDQDAPR